MSHGRPQASTRDQPPRHSFLFPGPNMITSNSTPSSVSDSGRASLILQVTRGVLAVIVAVPLLAAVDVNHSALNPHVAQLIADRQQMRSAFEHISRKRMPEQVRPDAPVEPGTLRGDTDQLPNVLGFEGLFVPDGREKQVIGRVLPALHVFHQDGHALTGNSDDSLLVEFPDLNADQSARDIDIANHDVAQFVVSHAGIGKQGKDGFVSEGLGRMQEDRDFSLAESMCNGGLDLGWTGEVNRPAQECGEPFEGRNGRTDRVIRSVGAAHLNDVFHQPFGGGIEADRGIAPPDEADIQRGGRIAKFDVVVEPCLELEEDGFEFVRNWFRFGNSHACQPLSGDMVRAAAGRESFSGFAFYSTHISGQQATFSQ